MSERPRYSPRQLLLGRRDRDRPEGAKAFYRALFGWESEDMPVGEGVYYTIMRLEGEDVAAISPQPKRECRP